MICVCLCKQVVSLPENPTLLMPYNIYRNAVLLSIDQERISRTTRPQEIVDPVRRRPDYHVTVAQLSDVPYKVSISDFKAILRKGDKVSVAVNDKWDVIALVNHTTGAQRRTSIGKMKFGDWSGIFFFISIPSALCFFIAKKALATDRYHHLGIGVAVAGVLIILLILRGVNKQFSESRRALRDLRQ